MRLRTKSLLEAIENIPADKFPNHVLIIPDGNGRWAKKFNSLPSFGHKQGFRILQKVIRNLQDLPINILTIWAFSSDNWKRSKSEIDALMNIYEIGIREALPELIEKKIRFIHLGRKDRLSKNLLELIEKAEEKTNNYSPRIFSLAIDFSGMDQEIRMMEKVLKLPKKTKINLELIESLRDSKGLIPPADLIIRTSGEQRTSDLGWLSLNSEFYSIKKMFPETSPDDYVEALIEYSKRKRRFGARIS